MYVAIYMINKKGGSNTGVWPIDLRTLMSYAIHHSRNDTREKTGASCLPSILPALIFLQLPRKDKM